MERKKISRINKKEYNLLEDDGFRMMKSKKNGYEYHEAKRRLMLLSGGKMFA